VPGVQLKGKSAETFPHPTRWWRFGRRLPPRGSSFPTDLAAQAHQSFFSAVHTQKSILAGRQTRSRRDILVGAEAEEAFGGPRAAGPKPRPRRAG